jgi:chromate transport protein ChrA
MRKKLFICGLTFFNKLGIYVEVKRMFEDMSNTLKVASLALVIINMYVLVFSNLPFFYRVGFTVYIFILLMLFSIAFQSLERLEKAKPA